MFRKEKLAFLIWLLVLYLGGSLLGYFLYPHLVPRKSHHDLDLLMSEREALLGGKSTNNPFLKNAPPITDILQVGISKHSKRQEEDGSISQKVAFVIASKDISESQRFVKADFYCDGVDDHVEIQSALNNLKESDSPRYVTLLAGEFLINEQIVLPANVVLQGVGIARTIIKLQDHANPFRYAGMIRGEEVENIEVKNMTVHGNKVGQEGGTPAQLYGRFGFYCEVCINVVLSHVHFTENYGYGIDPHGKPGEAIFSEVLLIDHCISSNNGWDGITIDKTKNTTIQNSLSENNGRHGINLVTGTLYTIIHNTTVKDNGWYYYEGSPGNGITVQDNDAFGTGYSLIEGNTIINSSSRGVRDDTGIVGDVIRGNTIDGPNDCIYALNTINLTIDSNDCKNGKKVTIEGSREGLVVTNQPIVNYVPVL